jgi:hypothetical protein
MFLTHKGGKCEDVELLDVSVEEKEEPVKIIKQGNVIYFTICPNVVQQIKPCKFYSYI